MPQSDDLPGLTKEEKRRLKTLEDYDRGVMSGQIKPSPSNKIEDILNYMMQPSGIVGGGAPPPMVPEKPFTQTVRDVATLPTAASIPASEIGQRVGTKIGRVAMAPYGPVAQEIGGRVGGFGGRVTGAGLGGMFGKGAEMALSPEEKQQQEDRWNALYKEGMAQAEGEVLGVGTELAGQGVRAFGHIVHVPSSYDVKSLMAYMQDTFEKALVGLRDRSAQSVSDEALQEAYRRQIDPTAAAQVGGMGGLSKAERTSSRFLDLLQGMAMGSWLGGGRMRQLGQTRDQLLRAGALQLGIDVGKYADPSDLAQAVLEGAATHLDPSQPGKLILTLRQGLADSTMNGIMLQLKTGIQLKKLTSTNKMFDFATQFNGQFVSPQVYRKTRDQLVQVQRDLMVSKKNRLEAMRLTGLLDEDAMKWMPAGAADDVRTLQKLERGVYDRYTSQSLVRGLLTGERSSRDFIDTMMQNPDYRRIQDVMEMIPDQETKDSMKRALLDKVLEPATIPGGPINVSAIRENVERRVGRAPIENVIGSDVRQNLDKYLETIEFLQAYKGRGETGRVMTALTQGTMFNRYATAMGGLALGGYINDSDWAQNGGLLAGSLFLLSPFVASRYLTSSRAKEYMRFAKAAHVPTTTPQHMRKLTRDLMSGIVDNRVIERLMGRGLEKWGAIPGDQQVLDSLRDTAGVPNPVNQPGPNYPEGMETGR